MLSTSCISAFLCCSPLLLVGFTSVADAFENALAVLVDFELGDFDLRWGNADGNGLAVGLLAADSLNVHDVFEAVDRCDLALAALVAAALNDDLVVLADRDGANLASVRRDIGAGWNREDIRCAFPGALFSVSRAFSQSFMSRRNAYPWKEVRS